MKKSIDFLITQNCNYRCEYCSQSKKFVQKLESASDATISAFLNFLDSIDENFEITISGGEPFCHNKFFYLAENIVKKGHKISVVSNFSFPFEKYKKLKDTAGDKLSELFVSLHLSQVKDLDEFLSKAEKFNNIKGETNFVIGSVLSDENCPKLKNVYEFLNEKNIKFELQHMRIKNSFVEYKKEAKEFINKFPIAKIKEQNKTYGKICYAGVNFMFIYQNGDCYRCYSSRFNKVHFLGNIKDKNFKMYKKPIPCLNKNCTCPKPIINKMIDFNKENFPLAIAFGLYNFLFLPYYMVKNFDIIKTKIIQTINLKK